VSEPASPPGPAEPDPAPPGGGYPSYHPPGDAPTTPWQPAPPAGPARQSTGVRSFVLALAPLLVTNVASMVLAVLTLARPRDGRDHGRGFAVVALVIDVLVVAAWVLVLALALG
jgi:hypothetical protein